MDEHKKEHSHSEDKVHHEHKSHHHSPKQSTGSSGSFWLSLIAVVLVVILLLQVSALSNKVDELLDNTDILKTIPEPSPTPTGAATGDVVSINLDDDPSRGPEDAKITIVEFSEFQCPYCKRGAATIEQIYEDYPGQIHHVFRDFPLSFHANAHMAAEAGECAADQDKFWEMHDMLFANQASLDKESIKGYAAELGLDTEVFNECLDSGKYSDEVDKDMQEGQGYGIKGVPAFFINGQLVSGAQPYENFKQVVDAELAK